MRLKSLKLAGFKSFVDRTEITFPADFAGVVGPNGCGKSNLLDAVRWVLGEGSAKALRSESMAQVIFNGAASRAPAGRASVELIFDNSDQSVGGSFAKYSEISLRREVDREGQSTYTINRNPVRRRDVRDLLRGSGLGARSYAILEQGMVNRIIEARPEELRAFIEEAAGISHYKERRQETENRIRHTRENLARLSDLLGEQEQRLRQLKRQAGAAERYQKLRETARETEARLLGMRLADLDRQIASADQTLEAAAESVQSAEQASRQAAEHNQGQRQSRGTLQAEHQRAQQDLNQAHQNERNAERRLQQWQAAKQQRETEIARLDQREQDSETQGAELDRQIADLAAELDTHNQRPTPDQPSATDARMQAESAFERWQQTWTAESAAALEAEQAAQAAQNRLQQLETERQYADERHRQLRDELEQIHADPAAHRLPEVQAALDEANAGQTRAEQRVARTGLRLDRLARLIQGCTEQGAEAKAQLQERRARLQWLEQLQNAALGSENAPLQRWLDAQQLKDAPTLLSDLSIADGWQVAVEHLLGDRLKALRVNGAAPPDEPPPVALTLLETAAPAAPPADLAPGAASLLHRIDSPNCDLAPLLGNAFTADSFEGAMALRDRLSPGQCLALQDGTLIGRNWLGFPEQTPAGGGVLARAEEIEHLTEQLPASEAAHRRLTERLEQLRARRTEAEAQQRERRAELDSARTAQLGAIEELARARAAAEAALRRRTEIEAAIAPLAAELETSAGAFEDAQSAHREAARTAAAAAERRTACAAEREAYQQAVSDARESEQQLRDHAHTEALTKQRVELSLQSLKLQRENLNAQKAHDSAAKASLQEELLEDAEANTTLEQAYAQAQAAREAAAAGLAELADRLGQLETDQQQAEQAADAARQALEQAREAQHAGRLSRETLTARRQTLVEQEPEVPAIEPDEPPSAEAIAELGARHKQLTEQITRLEPVNLMAVEELAEAEAGHTDLDTQREDLEQSLELLAAAIETIDQESRARLQETFDKLNIGFGKFFPQLFGGGRAALLLEGSDPLTAGVRVQAQPPGKRNSGIGMLSSGEKTMVAIALLFALFSLQPAPLCFLDEVDAPLDDSNAERYCATLRSLSELSQVIVITHNKITMASADFLLGVSMAEAGVSRLVSVDLHQALELAGD